MSDNPAKDMPVVPGVKEDQADLPAPALGSYKQEQNKLTDDLRRQSADRVQNFDAGPRRQHHAGAGDEPEYQGPETCGSPSNGLC